MREIDETGSEGTVWRSRRGRRVTVRWENATVWWHGLRRTGMHQSTPMITCVTVTRPRVFWGAGPTLTARSVTVSCASRRLLVAYRFFRAASAPGILCYCLSHSLCPISPFLSFILLSLIVSSFRPVTHSLVFSGRMPDNSF